jgi:hypothetical protein
MTTRERVRAAVIANPVQTMRQIADEVGVTTQRVQQIINEERLTRTRPITAKNLTYCDGCGKRRYNRKHRLCRECSPTWGEYVTLACEECGTSFRRLKSLQTANRRHGGTFRIDQGFCTKKCYGRWWGRHHGRGPQARFRAAALELLASQYQVRPLDGAQRCMWCEQPKGQPHEFDTCPVGIFEEAAK